MTFNKITKKSTLKENKAFLDWLTTTIKGGYLCLMDLDEMQDLIDSIVAWYELKYPERMLINLDRINNNERFTPEYYVSESFRDMKDISKELDIDHLLYTLSDNQVRLILCHYQAKEYCKVGDKPRTLMSIRITRKDEANKGFAVLADPKTGRIEKSPQIGEYIDSLEDSSLEALHEAMQKNYSQVLDFSELTDTIHDYECDNELRHRLLLLSAIGMVYSDKTTPIHGYERAEKFINDFNEKYGLTLSMDEVNRVVFDDPTVEPVTPAVEVSTQPESRKHLIRDIIRRRLGTKEKKDANN